MRDRFEDTLRQVMEAELASADFPEAAEQRILEQIHGQVDERRNQMKYSKKRIGIMLAAAFVVIGSITAIGAGKITTLVSHTYKDEAIHSTAQLTGQGKEKLGAEPKVPERFSDGTAFAEGYLMDVGALDEDGNQVGTYPELMAHYGENGRLSLSISKPIDGMTQQEAEADRTEEYEGITLHARTDHYLFLPPDAEPSEEDRKLQEAGRLMISYGSSEEERKVFQNVSWTEDGLEYTLSTFDEVDQEAMLALAKEVVDCGAQK
ncbi:MAG: hypothetical protein Q4F29_14345 [Lachnospiraceae bacterium]|nr:hypothetical protein [Lachnospiraceae bacterium]